MTVTRRTIRARDGFELRLRDVAPAGPAKAVAVLGHAMMVDGRTMYASTRPSLAGVLAAAGIHCLVADLRGHGESGPTAAEGGSYDYDELVGDTEHYLALARDRGAGAPVFLVGNSLFGHTSLAYLGQHPDTPVAGVVGFAVNIWNGRFTSTAARYWAKRAVVAASRPVVGVLGRLPARRLRLGTVDEPAAYWQSLLDWVPTERWASADGRDYHAALHRVDAPVLCVVSDGDRLLGHPDDAELFTAPLRHREVLRVGPHCNEPSLRGLRPGHVEMVSSPTCVPLWRHVARWILRQARQRGEPLGVDP